MRAKDIGVGSNGQVWIVNTDGKTAFLKDNKFWLYGSTPCEARRVTVTYNGQPWIACTNGKAYASSSHSKKGNKWYEVGAWNVKDIAAGPGGDILINGFNGGIWKYVKRQRN
jgi:hypothetical protein